MLELIAVYGVMFAGIALLIFQDIHLARRNAVRPAAIFPDSRKHIRVTVWSNSVSIAYYDHGGRKVTARRYPFARYGAVIASAKARGYAVI